MKQKCESCNSCGMPLEKKEDFALNDESSSYCTYCVNQKGELVYHHVLKLGAI